MISLFFFFSIFGWEGFWKFNWWSGRISRIYIYIKLIWESALSFLLFGTWHNPAPAFHALVWLGDLHGEVVMNHNILGFPFAFICRKRSYFSLDFCFFRLSLYFYIEWNVSNNAIFKNWNYSFLYVNIYELSSVVREAL